MLVSWKWLTRYLHLSMDREDLESRLSFSGLNHEGTEEVGGDVVLDLEVTSNRGDCLGHLGVAREISVLYDQPVCVPEPELKPGGETIEALLEVENRFPQACPRYTARVIRGVKVGPSPQWMVDLLAAVGLRSVNNIVDATNFVMMECGQPLHAFDYAKVAGKKIVVRPASEGETIEAIDHNSYTLDPTMCVIADAEHASAVAGVMGGADSEVDDSTRDLVIEAAIFTPLFVRRTARSLKLQSPSSYRFERRVDPAGIDWASRRVCQLIVELAGGEVAKGFIDTAPELPSRDPVRLRLTRVEQILGVEIQAAEVERILTKLGCESVGDGTFVPPTWRHDLTREADLIEEVARIHGYDKIPSDAPIPVTPSARRPFDAALEKMRSVLTASGLSEAMTPSVVTRKLDEALSPWTDLPALETQTTMLEGARRLRRTLLPSLLQSRANNWSSAGVEADLFEIAHIYLPQSGDETLPDEKYCLGMVCGGDFFKLKGILEALCARLGIADRWSVEPVDCDGFTPGGAVQLRLAAERFGFLGIVDPRLLKQWKLPEPVIAGEVLLPRLVELAQLVPQQQAISQFPSIERDLNMVVAETVRWSAMERVVRAAGGGELADVVYRETYRDEQKDGVGKKRVLMTVELQSHSETLSGEHADQLIRSIVDACRQQLHAELLT